MKELIFTYIGDSVGQNTVQSYGPFYVRPVLHFPGRYQGALLLVTTIVQPMILSSKLFFSFARKKLLGSVVHCLRTCAEKRKEKKEEEQDGGARCGKVTKTSEEGYNQPHILLRQGGEREGQPGGERKGWTGGAGHREFMDKSFVSFKLLPVYFYPPFGIHK